MSASSPAAKFSPAHVGDASERGNTTRSRPIRQGSFVLAVGVALARSLATWLQTRRSDIAIIVTSPSGSVKLEAHEVKDGDVMPLLQEVLRSRDES